MKFERINRLNGCLEVPGDKSISHRAIMFGALANGRTEIHNFLQGADCLSTISCFQKLGIIIENRTDSVTIYGKGLYGLCTPADLLNVGNSGTTLRLISGILSGQSFTTHLTGDASICKRPMKRIITPLSMMGANIISDEQNGCAPLTIFKSSNASGSLSAIHYQSSIASAQVKSCILLAGLYADGPTSITEPYVSRNHTELMLKQFGGHVHTNQTTVTITPEQKLTGTKIVVPGDISSAAYFIVAALIVPNSEVVIKNVGINPTRDGILEVLSAMGADLSYENLRNEDSEPVCDIRVRTSQLHGVTIEGSLIPRLIDEIPVLAVAACYAQGTTIFKDAQELKVKESNRIDAMVTQLNHMGANAIATDDGMIIEGGHDLIGAEIDSKQDHRIAMSFAIASLQANGTTTIHGADCVNISYPTFYNDLKSLF